MKGSLVAWLALAAALGPVATRPASAQANAAAPADAYSLVVPRGARVDELITYSDAFINGLQLGFVDAAGRAGQTAVAGSATGMRKATRFSRSNELRSISILSDPSGIRSLIVWTTQSGEDHGRSVPGVRETRIKLAGQAFIGLVGNADQSVRSIRFAPPGVPMTGPAAGILIVDPACIATAPWMVDPTVVDLTLSGCRPVSALAPPDAEGWRRFEVPEGGFVETRGETRNPSTGAISFDARINGGGSGTFLYRITGVPKPQGKLKAGSFTVEVPRSEPAPPQMPAEQRRYSCEDGLAVLASYSDPDAGDAQVRLTIAQKTYVLTSTRSASGAKYAAATGRTPGRTLVWWTKGASAMLIEAPPGDESGSAEAIVHCDDTSTEASSGADNDHEAVASPAGGNIQKLAIRSDDPQVAITGLFRDGAPVDTTGLGAATLTGLLPMDEDGIECASEGLEIRMSNAVIYRPSLNLCDTGWAITVPTAGPAVPSPPPAAADGLAWQTTADDPAVEAWLVYGIPETDATALTASCQKGTGRVVTRLPSDAADAAAVDVQAPDRLLRYGLRPAVGDPSSEQGPQLEFELGTKDPLWAFLRNGSRLPYRIGNDGLRMLDSTSGMKPVGQFLDACDGD